MLLSLCDFVPFCEKMKTLADGKMISISFVESFEIIVKVLQQQNNKLGRGLTSQSEFLSIRVIRHFVVPVY